MIEIIGDLWEFHEQDLWCVVTTNGATRGDGACVMGRGVAKEAALRYPDLPFQLGNCLMYGGNHVHAFPSYLLFSFPVKHHWFTRADLRLIERSAHELLFEVDRMRLEKVYLVRPGCGNGGLRWESVKPILEPLFDQRFIVVERR